MRLYAAALGWATILAGQEFRIGVIGGTNLSPTFPSWSGTTYILEQSVQGRTQGNLRHVLIGPMIEVALPAKLSFEANAIRRPLTIRNTMIGLPPPYERQEGTYDSTQMTWQFPLLLKYHLPQMGSIQPFLAGGPSFRVQSAPIGVRPSRTGVTVGLGFDMRFGSFGVSPTIRYTRWGAAERATYASLQAKRDQVELLASFYHASNPSQWRGPRGRKTWLGVIAGVPITRDFGASAYSGPSYEGPDRRLVDFRFAAGLMLDVPLSERLSLDVNAIYRRLHFHDTSFVVLTWQFPVMAKYRLLPEPASGSRRLTPFLEGGPTFRLSGNHNWTTPSHFGVTAGAGVETRLLRWLRVSPTLRYTRWRTDGPTTLSNVPRTKADQLEALVGIAF